MSAARLSLVLALRAAACGDPSEARRSSTRQAPPTRAGAGGPTGLSAGTLTPGTDSIILERGGDFSNGQLVDQAGRFWWMRAAVDRRQGMDHQEFVITDRALKTLEVVSLPPRLFGSKYPKGFAISASEGTYLNVQNDTAWSVAPDGSLIRANPLVYRVSRSGGSAPPLSLGREAPPVRYEPAEREEWEQWREYTDSYVTASSGGKSVGHASVPDAKPAIRGVRGDDLGRIWVQVRVRAELDNVEGTLIGDLNATGGGSLISVQMRLIKVRNERGAPAGPGAPLTPHTLHLQRSNPFAIVESCMFEVPS